MPYMNQQQKQQDVYQMLQIFLYSLVQERGVDLQSAEAASMKKDLEERLELAISKVFIEHVPEGKRDELLRLLEEKDQKKLEEFVRANVPNLDQAVSAMLEKFRAAYLGIS
ncbi:MAG: hypothetical protein AB1352_01995 [Patescibacteria group bacterium]